MLEREKNEIDRYFYNMDENLNELRLCAGLILASLTYIWNAKNGQNVDYLYSILGYESGMVVHQVKKMYENYNKKNELVKKLTL